ncbi:MAG: AAA family ATPase, partial [Phycisphaerae bacterium]|nr:AAA family ATPase [Phycisphaerae bacterium]
RAICEHLRGSKRLIMVDEAHLSKLETLNTIRQLHDSTGCPVFLVGLPALGRMLTKGRDDDAMGATLFSRQGIVRDLTARCRQGGDRGEPLYSVEDIKRVFAKSQLRITRDAMEFLEGVANEPEAGGLRLANNALRLAMHVARTAAEPILEITVTALLDASRLLKGTETIDALANRIKQRGATKVA